MALAEYQCLRCGHEWSQAIGPSVGWNADGHFVQPHGPPVQCQRCGHLYMKWLNFEQFAARRFN